MDMGMGGHGVGMGGAAAPAAAAAHGGMQMHYMHMTFYWGKNSEILFHGWPGSSGGMYALALLVVFALAVLVECLSSSRWLESRLSSRDRPAAAGAARAAVHALRVGMAYVLMLALMSFNVGVLLVAVAGHAVGFLLFRAGLFGGQAQVEDGAKDYLAPAACC
ncbi:hypothetical protein CFC21_036243 [Triticum aestivum]|uniref:Copper transport protein n=2 Tax=Triticum aestivum TaxID=4565 RepID=A0A9R1F7P4_WHEAT|nr:copper transporter 3-like [Triticum aestivum]KAF7023805.1 hypothetical protein CFC21_036241 [Triticum aestivum]KAF7023808.1 hypothetical protein CFC21_036243 [Triticum aestivum]